MKRVFGALGREAYAHKGLRMNSTQLATRSRLAPLDWESQNFGFPVARLDARALSDDCVRVDLDAARRSQVKLVVATTDPTTSISHDLLVEFAGALTDRKATFARTLDPAHAAKGNQASPSESISPYDEGTVSPDLLQLAISAGVYSRFAVDARFPRAKFEEMYRIWIERSVGHELADVVFVAANSGAIDGFITVALSGSTGKIGLIAVAEQARGRGLGKQLVNKAHHWLLTHGASGTQVVTQMANSPACNLYRSCGYTLASIEHYYHFWPLAERN